MSILPRSKRLFDGSSKHDKIAESSAAFVVLAANCCLCHIAMTVTKRIIAFAVKLRVLGVGKTGGMQPMRSIERHLEPEKDAFIIPYFGKKIVPLVQTNTMERQQHVNALINVFCQTLGRDWTIL